jgi:hypothetical protein
VVRRRWMVALAIRRRRLAGRRELAEDVNSYVGRWTGAQRQTGPRNESFMAAAI